MPTYRNITIQLHSDTSDGKLGTTEFWLSKRQSTLTANQVVLELAPPANARHSSDQRFIPLLQDDANARVSVYVPIHPKSLFWLSYKIEPPPVDDTFYVFKLFANKKEVTTWCCDAENSFKGKTMFGLFDTNEPAEGGNAFEKRVFRFGPADNRVVGNLSGDKEEDRFLEVRVCRANVKKRVDPQRYISRVPRGTDVDLAWAGYSKQMAPQRFFKFGLIDEVNQPYATFRFYYRSWEEIDKLGLHMGQVKSEGSSLFDQTVDDPEVVGPPGEHSIQHLGRNHSFLHQDPMECENRHSVSGDYFANYPVVDRSPATSSNGPSSQPCSQPYYPTSSPLDSNSGFRAYPATVANHYGHHQAAHNPSPSFHHQMTSNLTSSFKRLSIPPTPLYKPLLSKGPLPPPPAKLATEQWESALTENSPPCPPPAPTSVELSLESTLQCIPPAPRNTLWVPPRETLHVRSPRKLIKRRSEESEVRSGSFMDKVLRRRSREGPLDV